MSENGKPRVENNGNISFEDSQLNGKDLLHTTAATHSPNMLREAAQANGKQGSVDGGAGSGATSEEDYDDLSSSPDSIVLQPASGEEAVKLENGVLEVLESHSSEISALSAPSLRRRGLPVLKTDGKAGTAHGFLVSTVYDEVVRDAVQHTLQRLPPSSSAGVKEARRSERSRFTDLVFTRKFSAFDRQNQDAANSPFHGFFTLFWMGVFFFVVKIGVDNWRSYGSPLGTNEIMKSMFRRDILVLLIADGVMCGATGVSWLLQRAGRAGYLDWDRTGWVIQNIWQSIFIGAVIELTLYRDWPWSHTVFFVMHGMVMLMKQHSYAFYNGYLSSAFKKRSRLLSKLKELECVSPVQSPSQTEPLVSAISTSHLAHAPSAHEYKERRRSMSFERVPDIDKIAVAISSGEPLDEEQVHLFGRILQWEVDALSNELRGKTTTGTPMRAYPNNLTLINHYEFIALPTLVYELEYPRSESINFYYAVEKIAACFGVIFVMIMISQAFIYPVVMDTVRMKEQGVPLAGRFERFPWMLADLMFPFMMEYLLAWYLIWETILNFLAEMTYFADRSFYDAWWNSVSWDQFARDWNRPVHNFLLRHVYHSSISAMKVDKHTATLITFFLSACVHELVMWCIFKKLRGYLLVLQMCQLPLVRLSRTKWLRNQATLGNIVFWLGIFTGPSILCSLYLIL